eukprot:CAMPEP_0168623616 /NCGR_PEP_ID=MMETSP0449_2-20121227/8925_1 /TAXON_ID=1082188 /ORGANISM="Strombidium rassoulzadegani, Strain ras09" /LENGTH=71 /DNA_ID=CAMNT_0008665019 /DNA_START=163 /DNA_END=377 /DNA_ORIENTATION=-
MTHSLQLIKTVPQFNLKGCSRLSRRIRGDVTKKEDGDDDDNDDDSEEDDILFKENKQKQSNMELSAQSLAN